MSQTIPIIRVKRDLELKGRAQIGVDVEVVDESGTVALAAVVEWFIVRAEKPSS